MTGGIPRVLAPPSPYSRRLPLLKHPSEAVRDGMRNVWRFHSLMNWSIDRAILARNAMTNQTKAHVEVIGGGGAEWGAWCELSRTDDEITSSSLPFFGDIFYNLPALLPASEPANQGTSDWFVQFSISLALH